MTNEILQALRKGDTAYAIKKKYQISDSKLVTLLLSHISDTPILDSSSTNSNDIDNSSNPIYEYEASPTDQYNYSHTFLAVGILLLQSGAILSLQTMFAELWNDQIISWCIALALPLLTLLVIQTGAKQYIAYFTITCTAFIETIVNAVQITKHLLHNTELSTAIHHTAALNDYAFAWLISLVLCVVSIMCEIHYFNLKNEY